MPSPPITLSLADDVVWSLSAASQHDSAPAGPIDATVPGCVHTDLMLAGVIEDPFVDENELHVAWVADVDWVYSTSFRVSTAMLAHDCICIEFDGLDTLAVIAVNGNVVATTQNMHRSYRFPIRSLLHEGVNQLTVTFASATRRAEELRMHSPGWPAASFGRPYNYVRKMACSWGWDWGPWLSTAGIWRAAHIECWSGARIAAVRPTVNVGPGDHGAVEIEVRCERAGGHTFIVLATLADPDGQVCVEASTTISGDAELARLRIDAGAVERWWPHSHGEQPLYRLSVVVADGSRACGAVLSEWSERIGFRTVALDTTADDLGSAFTFVVNDLAIFARGVNWIPADPFPSRISANDLRERLAQAKAANVDLVRVWGGGLYESDEFYEICDELGLMVWQDFCFACAAYPEELLSVEVEAEARDNVERLMSHPALVLWNGNNENIWGWFDWGWQEPLDGRAWGDGFYFDLLPRVVAEIDPSRTYWPGSPYSGSMHVAANADAHGCTHVWDVWNELDLERYRDHTPRFVAEFGWQAPPTWNTLRASISDQPLLPDSPGMAHHQKAENGNAKLARGLRAHVGEPKDFDQWWWATQLIQARAVSTGVEHFRSLRGHCMGTIWWQLNDCWPATSWSVVDSAGLRKPAWYALRNSYRPHLLTVQPRGDRLVVCALNDSDQRWELEGTVQRVSFDGTVLAEERIELSAPAGSAMRSSVARRIVATASPATELIVVTAGGERALWWFLADTGLALTEPLLTIESVSRDRDELSVTVAAHALVRDLAIMPDRLAPEAWVDRQLDTLLPGESVTITVYGATAIDAAHLLEPDVCFSANSAVASSRTLDT